MLVNFRKNIIDCMNEEQTHANEAIQKMAEDTCRIIRNSLADILSDKTMVRLERDLKLEINKHDKEILRVMLRDDIDSAFDDIDFVTNYHNLKDRHLI